MREKVVTLSMGGGGKQTNDFIKNVIIKNFGNEILSNMGDAAHVETSQISAFTTDSFVVSPEFFCGGDIGKLSICGTVNDLAVSGAIPRYLSFSLIIAEGYPLDKLEKIIESAAKTASSACVKVVCGDTKVVERGSLDKVVINTAGIGTVVKNLNDFSKVKEGDRVIITSDIARHGMAVMIARGELGFTGSIDSDCACLNKMFEAVYGYDIKFARDATRGGLAAVLNEISSSGVGFEIDEDFIPVREDVLGLCETLGFDPLSVANEGAAVIIVSEKDTDAVLASLTSDVCGKRAAIIGRVTSGGRVVLKTKIGGTRYVDMPPGELLPRIC